jgi:hypothetical protein
LCFFTLEKGLEVLKRQAGDITRHPPTALHGVTKLTAGTRYSLFIVDESNGLGDECVVEPTPRLVSDVLTILEREAALSASTLHASIPFADITVGDQIGAGAFKTVFAGTWTGSRRGEEVCVVQYRADAPPGMVASELEVVRAIGQHPNVLRFHGCSVHLEQCYLVVERAPFGSLRDYLLSVEQSGPLKPVIALEIGLQVCRAMQQLHTLGILHRDLAAKSVLLFAISGRSHHDVLVKIGSFGRARQIPAASGDYYGAEDEPLPARWTAPEVLQRRKYSEKSDVWAFGVMLWEVLSLAMLPYYECLTDEQVVKAVVGGTKLAAPVDCPAAVFERCLLPCWAQVAGERPDFAGLLPVLRAVQEELLVQAAAEGAGARAERTCCVCSARPSSCAMVPCGHLCLCDGAACTAVYQAGRGAQCPICRAQVASLLHILA